MPIITVKLLRNQAAFFDKAFFPQRFAYNFNRYLSYGINLKQQHEKRENYNWTATGIIFLMKEILPAFTSQTALAKEGIRHLGYPAYFVLALIQNWRADAFSLFINPTMVANGMQVFKALDSKKHPHID
jgi:hypothetical protein